MKHSFKKALLAGVVAAAFCGQAFSADADAPSAPAAAEKAVAVEKPAKSKPVRQDLTSKLPADLINEIDKSGDHTKELDDLIRRKAILQAESDLEKLELEQARTRAEMDKVKHPSTADQSSGYPSASGIDPFTGLPLGAVGQQAVQQVQTSLGETAIDLSSPLDKIFVTRIYGIGDKKTVTVYVDNGVIQAEVGDEVYDGVKLISATDTNATFSYKGKKRKVNLTTQEQAYSRTFEGSPQLSTQPAARTTGGSLSRQAAIPSGMTMQNLRAPTVQSMNAPSLSGGPVLATPPGF